MTKSSSAISRRTLVWEDRTAWPMFLLSIVFFASWVWLLADPSLSAGWTALLAATVIVTWGAFIADFVVRLSLAGHRRQFLRERWFEVASLVVPYLRPFVILAYIWRVPWFRVSAQRRRAQYIVMVSIFTFLFVFTASALVWLVERDAPGANIVDLGDAIWWGFATIATVGYGDFVPVTVLGRVLAVGLMMGGLVVLGVTSGTIISALTDRIHRAGERLAHEHEVSAPVPEQRRAKP
ncbi:potassium channel family protein [Microbacterium sp. zg-YB36]|uniref:potassium channel family protein n=1 Tax=Microbacterium sp. zg-YB36 TaxID=2969407 RepID=UPI00214CF1E2|nr:potassium channel family protein [Microbacterium sp. zg-YB36]MDL5352035.1 potassium channel family protein [Microbacterium sp. zg-YB36]